MYLNWKIAEITIINIIVKIKCTKLLLLAANLFTDFSEEKK